MDAQAVKSYHAIAEADQKGSSVRAASSSTGKLNSSKRLETRSAVAGAAAAASPTTSSLQFFSYVLRLLTSGYGFQCISEAARARITASEKEREQSSKLVALDQRVEMLSAGRVVGARLFPCRQHRLCWPLRLLICTRLTRR